MKAFKLALAGALAAGLAMAAGSAAAEIKAQKFTVIGTWGFLDHWKERESVFWNETLPNKSKMESVPAPVMACWMCSS